MVKTSVVDIHKVKGLRPPYDVYIGRKTRFTEFMEDSKWGNKFYQRLDLYEKFVRETLWDDLDELIGKKLGCWCITTDKTEPLVCHGQVLMKLIEEKLHIKKMFNTEGVYLHGPHAFS